MLKEQLLVICSREVRLSEHTNLFGRRLELAREYTQDADQQLSLFAVKFIFSST